MNRFSVLIFLLAYFVVALLWPSLKVWRRTGVWPATFLRSRAPIQKGVGAAFALLLILMVAWSCFKALFPESTHVSSAPSWMAWLGWFLMVAGLAITVMAQMQMGSSWRIGIDSDATPLVTEGLFRYVRNPIFTSMLLTLGGLVLLTPAWVSLALWLATALVIAIQVRLEEQHLLALHGQVYRDYAQRAGRFIPGVGKLRTESAAP